MASKHTGAAENMKPGGANESSVSRQNAPFRDLHMSGHDLNHTYKNPVAAATNITVNHSYMHPHSGKEFSIKARQVANRVKPMMQMGTGKV